MSELEDLKKRLATLEHEHEALIDAVTLILADLTDVVEARAAKGDQSKAQDEYLNAISGVQKVLKRRR